MQAIVNFLLEMYTKFNRDKSGTLKMLKVPLLYGVGFGQIWEPVVQSVSRYHSGGLRCFCHSKSLTAPLHFNSWHGSQSRGKIFFTIMLTRDTWDVSKFSSFILVLFSTSGIEVPLVALWGLLCGIPLTTHSSSELILWLLYNRIIIFSFTFSHLLYLMSLFW